MLSLDATRMLASMKRVIFTLAVCALFSISVSAQAYGYGGYGGYGGGSYFTGQSYYTGPSYYSGPSHYTAPGYYNASGYAPAQGYQPYSSPYLSYQNPYQQYALGSLSSVYVSVGGYGGYGWW